VFSRPFIPKCSLSISARRSAADALPPRLRGRRYGRYGVLHHLHAATHRDGDYKRDIQVCSLLLLLLLKLNEEEPIDESDAAAAEGAVSRPPTHLQVDIQNAIGYR